MNHFTPPEIVPPVGPYGDFYIRPDVLPETDAERKRLAQTLALEIEYWLRPAHIPTDAGEARLRYLCAEWDWLFQRRLRLVVDNGEGGSQ